MYRNGKQSISFELGDQFGGKEASQTKQRAAYFLVIADADEAHRVDHVNHVDADQADWNNR